MSLHLSNTSLQGLKGLVVGVANEHSIAWGCAEAFRAAGAELAVTYLNAKAEPHVRPLDESIDATLIEALDVENDAQMGALFEKISQDPNWGRLDFVLHSIAFAPLDDLHGPVLDTSREGFARAMDISCHSLIRLARHGDLFGEEAGLIGRPALTGAQALRDSRLLLIPISSLRTAMSACPAFAAAIGTRLAAAAYEMMAHLQLCVQLNSTQRVAQYLSQLAPKDAECCEIQLENDKQTIAAQLNLTPETLSRVLSRFTREGMIRSSGRRRLMLDKLSQLRSRAAR